MILLSCLAIFKLSQTKTLMVKINKIVLGKKRLGLLSPLEYDVLRVLWKKTPHDDHNCMTPKGRLTVLSSNRCGMKVRDIYKSLRKKRKVALTSVAVILDRLHEKKIVRRSVSSCRGGYHYIYSATPRHDFEQSVVEKTVDRLIDNFGSVAVTYFNERFSKRKKNK